MDIGTKWRREARTAAEQLPARAEEAQAAQVAAQQAVRDARDAEKTAAQLAKTAAAELAAVRSYAVRQLDDVSGQLAAAVAAVAADGHVFVAARGPARQALYGDATLLAALPALAAADGHVSALLSAWGTATATIARLAEVDLGESDEVVQRVDALECAAWSALLARVRVCAGESNG